MFFIDALLRHNIFPLQHWVQRRGALLEVLFRISERYFFGPHHLIMAALLYFEEKVIGRSYSERMLFHFSSPDCYARFWSIWDTQQSLSLSVGAFVERYSLSTNGRLVEIPADMRAPTHAAPTVASPEPSLEVAPSAAQATPRLPLGLCHTFQALATSQSILTQHITALSAHQAQIIATQTQHTTILRQIQYHLGIISAPEHATPISPEPSQASPFVE
ncbi:hypothetical protein CK203_014601 [Vitis vinifera]|uniref:Uncharacterized protein n=1 Tax=Vitis vinifera TaxID=29760 RepID=A0A438K4M7_VITVI|nr:hypothetical protein CK203_014601 [Vitis vinifera]